MCCTMYVFLMCSSFPFCSFIHALYTLYAHDCVHYLHIEWVHGQSSGAVSDCLPGLVSLQITFGTITRRERRLYITPHKNLEMELSAHQEHTQSYKTIDQTCIHTCSGKMRTHIHVCDHSLIMQLCQACYFSVRWVSIPLYSAGSSRH